MNRTQNPTGTAADTDSPTVVVTPADILRGAAYYLEEHGWNRRNYYAEGYKPFPPACVAGAIGMAAFGRCVDLLYLNTDPRVDREGLRDYQRAVDFFCTYRTDQMQIALDTYDPASGDPTPEWDFDLYAWNDHAGQTAEHVIATLRAAADEYDRTHGSLR
ncbi:DUF6197 family protein [Couchioplanes caeruleus]|uniref:Uncharacterized protein n=2 Tax=Couchioplanes caeruleus TaxID=56438 RepID=A0A1K0FC22_9ACTN|nr:hypothetical protein [Couchioplanes caeruleus]OJF10399.1 hypothetical protein BG844_32210 [Couchioplanes caeruleus subsp. caeruleus]ROP29787.1 hypothetical protein EDD30_2602 [Couchioplanes caeruleus]